jgi:hypothetical protein
MTSSQPAALGRYLAPHGFAPSPADLAWLDLHTGHQVIRICAPVDETAFVYFLDPRQGCLYEARFSPGTPDAVITAAIGVARHPPRPGPARPRACSAREGKREP